MSLKNNYSRGLVCVGAIIENWGQGSKVEIVKASYPGYVCVAQQKKTKGALQLSYVQ